MKYIYLLLLMIMFYTLYKGILVAKKAPFKIKLLTNIAMWGLFIRAIALFIMFITQNIAYLYLAKPFIFLDLICIPLLAVVCICILARNNKVNFSYLFIILILLFGVYLFFVGRLNSNISANREYGYVVKFYNETYICILKLIMNSIFLFMGGILFRKKNLNKSLIMSVIIISMVSIIEVLFNVKSISLVPNFLISNCLWIIISDYILYKIKK